MISRIICVLIFLVTPYLASANILDRMKLEDTIKERVEEVARIADPDARILVQIEFKSYNGSLPGTKFENAQDFTPNMIDRSDISKVTVKVFSELESFAAEVQEAMLTAVPFEKSRVKLEIKKVSHSRSPTPKIDAEDLREITTELLDKSFKFLGMGVAGLMTLLFGFLFFIEGRKSKGMREQIQILASAFSESGDRVPERSMASFQDAAKSSFSSAMNAHDESGSVQKLSKEALCEILADCYWAELDAYAHWIWTQLDKTQQASLIKTWPKLIEYSSFFVSLEAQPLSYHQHPYYLQPLHLMQISQKDMLEEISEDLGRWHLLGPIRQEFLPLDLMSKLKAVQTKPPQAAWSPRKVSDERLLKTVIRWGELSANDELAILSDPQMVPDPFRNQIKSLVWLAQRDSQTIAQVLERFDARSLAEAWVGPAEVLEKLEKQLPDKKLKLLKTYLNKTSASRASPAYLALVEEGLRINVA